MRFVALSFLAIFSVGCAEVTTNCINISGPRLRILGTVQDGGLPHAACACPQCEGARNDPQQRRFVSCMALLIPQDQGHGSVYLFDATPDIREQLHMLRDVRDIAADRVDRAPVDGVFLTHAHIGHYLGLAFFGFEAVHTEELPVWCTPRMTEFLRNNGPWSQLVQMGNVEIQEAPPDSTVDLPSNGARTQVEVRPIRVPHRDEYADTVGYVIRRAKARPGTPETSPNTVLYISDTEPWAAWLTSLVDLIEREGVTVAILDGTFYSLDELPGRAVTSIGHPLMTSTMDLLAPMVEAGSLTVYFTHMNHSNPALDPNSPAAREIARRGFRIAREGLEIPL